MLFKEISKESEVAKLQNIKCLPVCIDSAISEISRMERLFSLNGFDIQRSIGFNLVAETLNNIYDIIDCVCEYMFSGELQISASIDLIVECNIQECLELNIETTEDSNEYYLDSLKTILENKISGFECVKKEWEIIYLCLIKVDSLLYKCKNLVDSIVRKYIIYRLDLYILKFIDKESLIKDMCDFINVIRIVDRNNLLSCGVESLIGCLSKSDYSLVSICNIRSQLDDNSYILIRGKSKDLLCNTGLIPSRLKFYLDNYKNFSLDKMED